MGSVRWVVDRRRISVQAWLYVRGMRVVRDKRAFEGERHTVQAARERQRSGDRPPTRWTTWRCRVTTESFEGMTVWRVRSRRRRPTSHITYLHGGGYIHPLTVDYWRLMRALVRSGAEVLVPAYPLAPDATADEVVPRLTRLTAATSAERPTVLMGDSAGGALSVVVAAALRDQGGTQAAGVVALCPWLDATLDEEAVEGLESTDPMLAESGLRAAGRWWAGDRDAADPMVSPVNAELSNLPRMQIWIGDHDILRPAVDAFADRARAAQADLTVHEVTAMFHVWMTRPLPEARRTRRALADTVRSMTAASRAQG